MTWRVSFSKKAEKDREHLSGNERKEVYKAIAKVSSNPVSIYEGGYGHPLGKIGEIDLRGCYKIKLKKLGIRVVYELIVLDSEMLIIVIGARKGDDVYEEAFKRRNNGAE